MSIFGLYMTPMHARLDHLAWFPERTLVRKTIPRLNNKIHRKQGPTNLAVKRARRSAKFFGFEVRPELW